MGEEKEVEGEAEVEVGYYNDLCLTYLCHHFGAERKGFLIAQSSAFIWEQKVQRNTSGICAPKESRDNEWICLFAGKFKWKPRSRFCARKQQIDRSRDRRGESEIVSAFFSVTLQRYN